MAKVLVALRSFFADDFSRFFFDALCTLYIVNLESNKTVSHQTLLQLWTIHKHSSEEDVLNMFTIYRAIVLLLLQSTTRSRGRAMAVKWADNKSPNHNLFARHLIYFCNTNVCRIIYDYWMFADYYFLYILPRATNKSSHNKVFLPRRLRVLLVFHGAAWVRGQGGVVASQWKCILDTTAHKW